MNLSLLQKIDSMFMQFPFLGVYFFCEHYDSIFNITLLHYIYY